MPLKSDLRKLAREGDVLTIRNKEKTVTTFSLTASDPDHIEWQPFGDIMGGDIQDVPATHLRSGAFITALSSGVLELVDADDPAVLEAFEAQTENWKARQEQKDNAADILVATTPTAEAFSCIAPEGAGICGDLTTMPGNSVSERPPLCPKHAGMKSQFISEPTGRRVGGRPEVIWQYAQLTQ